MHRSGPILLASTNPAKQAKLRWLLDGLGLRSITPGDLGLTPAIPEDGADHRAIAEAKAAAWSRAAGMAALSSDGGLVIPALGDKWEALRTGRFAGENAGDRQRLDRLLELMKPYHGLQRKAHWVEAAAIASGGETLGSWQANSPAGLIAEEYDAARLVPGFWAFSVWRLPGDERAFAELSPEEQDQADDHWTRLRRQVRLFFDQV